MKRFPLLLMIVCCVLVFCLPAAQPAQAAQEGTALVNTFSVAPEEWTSADTVLVVDRDSGLPLYEKNAGARIYPASTTKMMTALCAVDAVKDLDEKVTVRQDVLDQLPDDDNSLAGLEPGEKLTVRQLLYCLMLPSGNDAAQVIANYVGGSESGFAEIMNQRAAALGCTDTYFVNAHGLAGEEQYSTAWDLARIAEAYMQEPELAKIAKTASYTFSTDLREEVTVKSSNLLLDPESELYEPAAQGIKTGTMSLGASFVSAAEQDGLRVICVAAGVPARDSDGYLISPNPALAEGRKFLSWACSQFARVTLFDGKEKIPVELDGSDRSVAATAGGPVTAVIPKEQAQQITRVIASAGGLKAPLPAGTAVGNMSWYCGETLLAGPVPLYLSKGMSSVPQWLWAAMWIVLVLLAACTVFLQRRRKRRKQERQRQNAAAAEAWTDRPEWMKEVLLDDDDW